MHDDVVSYIEKARAQKMSDEKIHTDLLGVGWKKEVIEESFAHIDGRAPIAKKSEPVQTENTSDKKGPKEIKKVEIPSQFVPKKETSNGGHSLKKTLFGSLVFVLFFVVAVLGYVYVWPMVFGESAMKNNKAPYATTNFLSQIADVTGDIQTFNFRLSIVAKVTEAEEGVVSFREAFPEYVPEDVSHVSADEPYLTSVIRGEMQSEALPFGSKIQYLAHGVLDKGAKGGVPRGEVIYSAVYEAGDEPIVFALNSRFGDEGVFLQLADSDEWTQIREPKNTEQSAQNISVLEVGTIVSTVIHKIESTGFGYVTEEPLYEIVDDVPAYRYTIGIDTQKLAGLLEDLLILLNGVGDESLENTIEAIRIQQVGITEDPTILDVFDHLAKQSKVYVWVDAKNGYPIRIAIVNKHVPSTQDMEQKSMYAMGLSLVLSKINEPIDVVMPTEYTVDLTQGLLF